MPMGTRQISAQIMLDNGDTRYNRRQLMARVVRSTLLYAANVCKDALLCETNRKRINITCHLVALTVYTAFRTILSEAAYVIAGIILMSILASEVRCLYDKRRIDLPGKVTEHQRAASYWKRGSNCRWTHSLVPRIEDWIQ